MPQPRGRAAYHVPAGSADARRERDGLRPRHLEHLRDRVTDMMDRTTHANGGGGYGPPTRSKTRLLDADDADTQVALLRTPAAIAAGGFVIGLTVGELAKAMNGRSFLAADYWAALAVCVPFLLASRQFDLRVVGAMLRAWLTGAAVIGTMRLAYWCAWSYARRPLSIWLVMVLLDVVVGAALWLAVYAVVWNHGRRTAH